MSTTLRADPDTERLAQKVAEVTGKSVPTVMKEAIAAKAHAVGVRKQPSKRHSSQDLIDRMTAISNACAARPVLDASIPRISRDRSSADPE